MRRVAKTLVVWAVVGLIAIDPALAGRFAGRGGYCAPSYCGTSYCGPYNCGPAYCCSPVQYGCVTSCYSYSEVLSCGSGPYSTVPSVPTVTQPYTSSPVPTVQNYPPAANQPTPPFQPPRQPAQTFGRRPNDTPLPPTTTQPPQMQGPRQPAGRAPTTPGAQPPVSPPPSRPADTSIDDLFREDTDTTPPARRTPADRTPPARSDEVDDLFRDTEPPAQPPAQPPRTTPPARPTDDIDDLFRDTRHGRPNGKQVATQAELEALFAEPAETVAPALPEAPVLEEVVAAAPVAAFDNERLWIDNTGNYRVQARLVMIGEDRVRLLKENGNYTTVPFNRLSADDLEFVRQHAGETSLAGK